MSINPSELDHLKSILAPQRPNLIGMTGEQMLAASNRLDATRRNLCEALTANDDGEAA